MRNLLCLSVFILLVSNLFASQTPDSLKTFYLPTVRVIVSKNSEAIGILSHLSGDKIASAGTIQEAMQNTPGITATSGSKDESNLRLRGFRKNEVKILIDGRPLTNGYFGNVDISKLALLDIAEIQVIKGPASPLFGTNTMGGVLNIITKNPNPKDWMQLNLALKRNNTQQVSIESSHRFLNWDYALGMAMDNTAGFVLSDDFSPTYSENGGVRNNSDKRGYNLRGSLGSELFTYHGVHLSFGYSGMDKKDIPSSIYERKFRRYEAWNRYNAGASGEFRLSDYAQLFTLISLDGAADRYLEYREPTLSVVDVDSDMKNTSLAIAPRIKWQLNGNKSLDFGYRLELQTNKRKDNGEYLNWTQSSLQLHSLFCQFEQQLSDACRLTSALGLAGSINDLKSKMQLIPEPAIGLVYEGAKGQNTAISLGISSARPTMRQLFSTSKGNPRLKPQYAYKAEISHFQPLVKQSISLSNSVFYNDTHRLIDLYQGKYENIYAVQSYGLESSLNINPINRYDFSISYSYLDYSVGSDYRLTETPKHSLDFAQRLKLPYNMKLQANSSYRHNRLSQDEIGTYHKLPSYWLHNVLWQIPWQRITFSLGIQNILDANYQGEYGFPAEGRNFSLGIKLTI